MKGKKRKPPGTAAPVGVGARKKPRARSAQGRDQEEANAVAAEGFKRERLLHELQVHQTELEAQNHELRETQISLELARDRYAELYDFAPVGYVTFDEKGVIREINLTAAQMLGVERERLLGVPFRQYVAREDLPLFRTHLATLANQDAPVSTELRLAHKVRGTATMLIQSVRAWDAEQKRNLHRTAITDLSARLKAEQELAGERNLLRTLIDAMPDSVFTKNMKGQFGISNPAHLQIAGAATEADLLGKTVFDVFPVEIADAFYRDDAEVFASGKPMFHREERAVKRDGTALWVSTTKVPLRNHAGEMTGLVGVSRDITEQKKMEDALRESERFVRAALNGLTASIALLDDSGTILAVNDAWQKFGEDNGLPRERSGEGVNYLRICDEARGPFAAGASEVGAAIRRVLQGGVFIGEIQYPCHSPTEQRWFLARITPFAGGGPRRVVIAHENITARKLAEAALESRSRQQQAVAELGQHALEGRDLDRLIHDAVALVPQVLGVEFCKVCELLPDCDDLLLRAGAGWQPGLAGHARLGHHDSLAGITLRANEPVIVTDFETESRFRKPTLLKQHGVESGICVIIYGRGRPFGAICAFSSKPRSYTGDDANFVQSVANVLAAAIERHDIEQELLKTSDEERARIGQDLHDDLCQQLVGIEFRIAVLKGQLAGLPLVQEEAAQIGGFVRDALVNARMLARGLSPVQFEAGGLMSALQEFVANMSTLFRVPCEFRCESPVPVADPFVATHLYRIAQEAVTNAARHSCAKSIVVSLALTAHGPALTIADDGTGCKTAIWDSTGMGLRIMQYRSEMIGATLRIQAGVDGGTVVNCEFLPHIK